MGERNYLEHDGRPNPKDQVEILKVVALAVGFCGGTAAIIRDLMMPGSQHFEWVMWIVALIGSGLSLWSLALSILAIRGRVPFMKTKGPQIFAYGLLFMGISWPIAIISGLLFE